MDVINKLYYTVSNTVSQISYALPGNGVTKEYEIFEHIASAGPGLVWKVYNGCKKTTKQEASIFVLEKKLFEKWAKDDREIMLDILKRSVIQLTKIRHPRVLTVQHPLEESRDSIAFATEPIFASLANILGNFSNLPPTLTQTLSNFKLHEVEIKYGLLQLTEGLAFLHTDAKMLHKNLTPESVIINKEGNWKIFGFDFAVSKPTTGESEHFPFTPYNSTYHILTQPTLDYMAPECILQSKHCPASDIYSLGILIYTLHSVNNKPVKVFGNNVDQFKKHALDLQNGRFPNLSCVPGGLSDYVRLMMHSNPEMRPGIYDLSKISYFDDVAVKTLHYLDSSFQWNNLQKSKFYKGLPPILKEMPHRINIQHIVPCLTKEFVNPQMVPFVLPNYFLIAEKCTKEEYRQLHLSLKPVLKMNEPIQILLILIQHIELLLKLTPKEDLQTDVLPMLYRALESDTQQIQELSLSILPEYAANVDYPTIKNGIIPRIRNICINSQNVKLVVNCLVCIGKLLHHMDKWLVLDDIIPFLMKIKTRDPAIIMGILGVIKIIMANSKLGITKDVVANKVIPYLMPLSIENNLSLVQFDSILTMIKDMIHQVETEHRSKLEQLESMQHVYRSPNENAEIPVIPFPATTIAKPTADVAIPTVPIQVAKVLSPVASKPNEYKPEIFEPMKNWDIQLDKSMKTNNINNNNNNNNTKANMVRNISKLQATTTTFNQSSFESSLSMNNMNASKPISSGWTLHGSGTGTQIRPIDMNKDEKQTLLFQSNIMGMKNDNRPLLQPTTSNNKNHGKSSGPATLSAQDIIDFLN